MRTYDAVVVGAGPAGTSTAIALAEHGIHVALIDRSRFPRVKACAEYVNPSAVEILDRFGLLERAVAAGGVTFNGMRLVAPGGDSIDLNFRAHSGKTALGVSREIMDHLAVERCRELGVTVIEGARVRDVLHDGNTVRGVTLGDRRDGITARVVVGADGHHSTIARKVGLERTARWPRRIGLAAHFEHLPLNGGLGELHVGRHGYCGIAPQERGCVNVAMVVDMQRFERRRGSVEKFFTSELLSYPSLRDRVAASEQVSRVRGVGPMARRVHRTYGDGFVLVGDAAGFFDPFTGEGIIDALQGGLLAASAIASALERDDTSAASLSEYEQSRRRAFADKRRAGWLVQAFVASPRMMDYAIGRIAARPGVVSTLTGVFGDYQNAADALSPRFLWGALRP